MEMREKVREGKKILRKTDKRGRRKNKEQQAGDEKRKECCR